MSLWESSDVDAGLNGHSTQTWEANGISIDTRTLNSGDLFFAVKGENMDGHDYVQAAFDKGAAACVISQKIKSDHATLVVEDTTQALQDLGKIARDRFSAKIIAVTGSVGKTGTKDMLRLVLSEQGEAVATQGNLNNHWGLPLSLSRTAPSIDYGIFELGMSSPGEISPLSKITRPHVAIITTVEPVHAEFFETVEQIADAKAEIFQGLEAGGVAILCRDNAYYDRLEAAAEKVGVANIISFGSTSHCQSQLLEQTLQADHSDVVASICGVDVSYRLGAPGAHLVMNSLAVLSAVFAVGGNVQQAAQDLVNYQTPKGRGQRDIVALPSGGHVTLIDESYNASPASMRAALDVIGKIQPVDLGKRIAVLGDMLELGDTTQNCHEGLLKHLYDNGFDTVFTAGPAMRHLWDVLPDDKKGKHSDDPAEIAALIGATLKVGDVVVVKGSLGSRVGQVVQAIQALNSEDKGR